MEEYEFMEPSFGEIVELIRKYEEAEKGHQQIFLEEENFDDIIQFYQDNREYGKALKVTEAAINQYPFSSFFYTKKAEILANQKHFDQALVLLEEAERLDPQDINIHLIRADVFLWQGLHTDAMEVVEYAMTIAAETEDRCELYLEMADIWEDQEKYPEVINSLKNAIRQDPMNEEGLNRMWFCTELTEQYEESVQFHEMVIEECPYSFLAWFNLGHAFAGLGLYEKALEAFGYSLAIDDKFDPAYTSTGDVFFLQEEYSNAIIHYSEAIRLAKSNKDLYLKLAACYEKLEDLKKARTYLRKAIVIDPNFEEAHYRIGELYRLEGNWPKAASSYQRAVKLCNDNSDYLMALAEAYLCMDEAEQALRLFEQIFQMDPESKQNWINLATAYYNMENYLKSFQVLNEAGIKFDHSADIYYIKSVFYNRAGNRHEALLNLEKGLLVNFNEHALIFEMDDSLHEDASFLQVIEQYRD